MKRVVSLIISLVIVLTLGIYFWPRRQEPINTLSTAQTNQVNQVTTEKTATDQPVNGDIEAEMVDLDFEEVEQPEHLAHDLAQGGYVIVFRYTGAGGGPSQVAAEVAGQVRDDGQRISASSIEQMAAYGQKYRELGIDLDHLVSSEYYFVWQHAQAAGFSVPIEISRDLTGSLDFSDGEELAQSLQALRNRTVTVPEPGKSTLLFTHQGKFDKAYGYYIPAGTTIIFKPDGSSQPRLVAVLSLDEFLAL